MRIYFVRHAESDYKSGEDRSRLLTKKGLEERKKVTEYLKDINITKIYSSPYQRTVDTVKHLAEHLGMKIELIEDFRERAVSNTFIEDFNAFAKRQWNDFSYKLSEGESLAEVQKRNIEALKPLLENEDEIVVIGTHGTSLSTILNYFDSSFHYEWFKKIQTWLPFIVCCDFKDGKLVKSEVIEL